MSENRPIKVTKIVNTYEAVHESTKLRTYDTNRTWLVSNWAN